MQKDESAFQEIIRANSGIILKVVNSYCKNTSDRDDLFQEIAFQLWRSWAKYNPEYKLSTWIYRVALNVAISFYRKSKRHSTVDRLEEGCATTSRDGNVYPELSEDVKQLYEFIGELDELNRAVILLYLERYSHEEIADTLGISKTNVATKVSRIKAKLKQRFELDD